MAKPARRRPVLRGALWLTAGVCTGIAIGIAEARLRARREASLAQPPRRLAAPLPPVGTAPPRPVRRRRARRVAVALTLLVLLAALGAGIAFVATGDTRQAAPTATTAGVAGTATVRRTATRVRTTTAAQTRAARTTTAADTRKTPTSKGAGATTTGFVPARVFAWPQVAGADRYEIRFYRGARLLLRKQIRQSRFALPGSLKLSPGRYRWVVLPQVRGRFGRAIVDSRFSVG